VVPNFISQALRGEPLTIYGDGMQTRSFCYVDDLIDGIYKLLTSGEHDPTNIGNPVETSIKEFAETINRLTGNEAGMTYLSRQRGSGDPQMRQPNIARAQEKLGWEPKVALEDGLQRTIEYFKEQIL
jgi:dTDP-glucose 4,6-dehydratase